MKMKIKQQYSQKPNGEWTKLQEKLKDTGNLRLVFFYFINHIIIKYIRYSAVCIHGDKSQYERDNVLKGIIITVYNHK